MGVKAEPWIWVEEQLLRVAFLNSELKTLKAKVRAAKVIINRSYSAIVSKAERMGLYAVSGVLSQRREFRCRRGSS